MRTSGQIGKLRHKITIEQPTLAQNTGGQPTAAWSTYKTAWARIESGGGGESKHYAEQLGLGQVLITTRYASGVTTDMRITHNGRTLNIDHVDDPDGRRRRLVIIAKEIT